MGGKKAEGVDEKTLTNLSLRIDSLKSRTEAKGEHRVARGGLGGMGLGGRVMVELVVAPCVGGGMGYSLDIFFGTLPFCLIVGVVLGSVAGVLNVKRLSDREDERVAKMEEGGVSDVVFRRRKMKEQEVTMGEKKG